MAATCIPRNSGLIKDFGTWIFLGFTRSKSTKRIRFRQNLLTLGPCSPVDLSFNSLACVRCLSLGVSNVTKRNVSHGLPVSPQRLSVLPHGPTVSSHHQPSWSLWQRLHLRGSTLNSPSVCRSFSSKCDVATESPLSSDGGGQGSSKAQGSNRGHGSQVVDPFKLVESEMSSLATDIRQILDTKEPLLGSMSHHLFDGKGKSFRPLIALLMSKACNVHTRSQSDSSHTATSLPDDLLNSQKIVAMVVEMIHAASLVHDDVIDASETRRGGPSLNAMHGQRLSILTGDYIMSQASIAISKTGNPRVIIILSTIMEDLVSGEFMQLGSKEEESERFEHYLKKTFRKTASLIANTCQSVAILAGCDETMDQAAFQYGKNLGIAFQLIDDMLDFTSSQTTMGKPTAADLKLGLATAPVLFAAQEHPELHAMIMRRFSMDGDVDYTRHKVAQSDGVSKTLLLARQHSSAAISSLRHLSPSPAKDALVTMATMLLERKK